MEVIRGWEAKHAPETAGRIRLSKATRYRDIETSIPSIPGDKDGETRLRVEGADQCCRGPDALVFIARGAL